MKIDPYCQRRNCNPICTFQRCIDCVDIARRYSARGRQTTVRWQKQVFTHTRPLSRAYLALARLSCYRKMAESCRLQHCQLTPAYNWRDVNHLIERLIQEWRDLDHNIICVHVNQWRTRLRAFWTLWHFEHLCCNSNSNSNRYLSVELTPPVFIVLETGVLSVSSKR